VQTYVVPQTTHQYAGFSAHKLTLNTSYALTSNINITPTVIYGGPRYAFTTLDEDGNAVSEKLDAYLLTNLFFNFRNIITPGLTAGIGVYDLLNERPSVPQAYLGEYAPVPGRSREYVVKLSYQLNFQKH
jgi:outer membrane receptor protein involved in Fe transport